MTDKPTPQLHPAHSPINAGHTDSSAHLMERTLYRFSNGEKTRTLITNDWTAAEHLLLIEDLTLRMIDEREDLFTIVKHRGQPVMRGTHRYLSDRLYQCLRRSDELLATHFPNHNYHPWVDLYLRHKACLARRLTRVVNQSNSQTNQPKEVMSRPTEVVENTSLFILLSGAIHHHIGESSRDICDALNAFVRDVRTSSKRKDFKKRLRNHHYAIEKNRRSLACYIDNLFQKHARLLVIRVDLGYGKVSPTSSIIDGVTAQDAKRHRERLLKNIPFNRLFAGLKGYVWKLEYGLEKGYHYHWIFFFDGRTRCRDVWLGQRIGEYWQKIVAGPAVYWNCNANKDGYRKLGIGMIGCNDVERRRYLSEAAGYLTKPDLHLRLVDPKVGRTFGRGEITPDI